MCSLMDFSMFTDMHSHHWSVLDLCIISKRNPIPFSEHFPKEPLTFSLEVSYVWNHTVCGVHACACSVASVMPSSLHHHGLQPSGSSARGTLPVGILEELAVLLFSRSVVSDSLWPHGLQHARLPCPSASPRICSNSCPLSWWYHPTISSSVPPSPPALNFSQHPPPNMWYNMWYFMTGFFDLACYFQGSPML